MAKKRKASHESPASAPLQSWDFFMENYHRLMKCGEDLMNLKKMAKAHGWKLDWDLQEKLVGENKVIIVTTLTQRIVFASSNLLDMTGYIPDEVLGQLPALFQGRGTALQTKAAIRASVKNRVAFQETLLNYRKNGQSYDCVIDAYPVYNKKGEVVNFIAFENEAAS